MLSKRASIKGGFQLKLCKGTPFIFPSNSVEHYFCSVLMFFLPSRYINLHNLLFLLKIRVRRPF